MKRILLIVIIVIAGLSSLRAQNTKVTYEPKGKWLFEAPYAPEGFTSGTIEVGTAEKKLTATISFTGNETKIPLDNVKFENDNLTCSILIEGSTILISLKFDDLDKMSGKAVTPDGEIPLVLNREKKK